MPLLGSAALAMWWDVSADVRSEWERWHAQEHFPERLALPGFLRATRWTALADGEGCFVVYELRDHAVLASAPYVARLNAPTPWSTRMMPLHRHMVRAQCQVVHSHGAFTARYALTVRCSAQPGHEGLLQSGLGALAAAQAQRPGVVGVHVLRHEAPALAVTTEQQMRGQADQAADWIVVACGYQLAALRALEEVELGEARLQALGAAPITHRQFHSLAYSACPADVR